MAEPPKELIVKSKIWIEDKNGELVFGAGRLRILDLVERHGSILAASKELHMSYRAAWGKIKSSEELLGRPLLNRRVGGAPSGGSELTPLGKTLVKQFRHLQTLTKEATKQLYQDVFPEKL